MLEIVRVKIDNGVLSVKLPLEARLDGEFKHGDYMVWTRSRGGGLLLKSYRKVVMERGRSKNVKSRGGKNK